MKATSESVAALFGVPVANVRAQYRKNAIELRECESKARAGKYRGYSAAQWGEFAAHAERQTCAS